MKFLTLLLLSSCLMAQGPGPHGTHDVRFNTPVIHKRLPQGHRVITHHRDTLYLHRGFWYRKYQGGYVRCYPPIGLYLETLPLVAELTVVNGVTYYVVEQIYYVQRGTMGYVVVEPPLRYNY